MDRIGDRVKQILIGAFLLASLGCSLAASAHAFLDHASPRVGSTVRGSPPELKLWFTQELEPAFSTARVEDGARNRIDRRDSSVDADDPTLLRVPLPKLAPGRYRVSWRVLSADTHVTEGDFTFEVAP